jgi:hypothetical protein
MDNTNDKKCPYCDGDGEHYQGPSQYTDCSACKGSGSAAPAPAASAGSIDTPGFRNLLQDHRSEPNAVAKLNRLIAHIDQHVATAVAGVRDAAIREIYEMAVAERAKMVERGEIPADPAPVSAAHPDDLAVDGFADAMKAKMAASREKGRGGWMRPERCTPADLRRMMAEHFAKGDPVDVGNFAMMLWYRGESTAGAPVSGAEPPKPHRWDGPGERCLDCGDKDWMAGPYCSGAAQPARQQEAEQASIDRQLTGAPSAVKQVDGQELPALPIKTWRERLPEGAGLSFNYAFASAMKAEIADLRLALAAAMRQPQGDASYKAVGEAKLASQTDDGYTTTTCVFNGADVPSGAILYVRIEGAAGQTQPQGEKGGAA